jgi:protein-S-isoprenylcysteine O-methyltransferase Ste14
MTIALIVLRVLALVGPLAFGLVLRLHQAHSISARPGISPEQPPAKEHHGSRVPTVFTYCALLLFVVPFSLPFTTIPGLSDVALLALAGAGLVLAAAGLAIGYWARATLGAAWGLLPRAGGPTGLVTSGPYARVRHPVYLGFSLGLLGIAVAFANWVALLIFLLLILPGLAWRAVVEERVLADTFGEEYRLYRQRTKMIVPFIL